MLICFLIFIIMYNLFGLLFFFFFNDPATTKISPLPLHDALPISIVINLSAGGMNPQRVENGRLAAARTATDDERHPAANGSSQDVDDLRADRIDVHQSLHVE